MNYKRGKASDRIKEVGQAPPVWAYTCPHCGRTETITRDEVAKSAAPTYVGGFAVNQPFRWVEMPGHIEQYFPGVLEMIKEDGANRYIHFRCNCGAPVLLSLLEIEVRLLYYEYEMRAVYESNTWPIGPADVENLPVSAESGAGYRILNFKSVELVRIGEGRARVTRVTDKRVEYTDELGRELFVDLEECARIGWCLETIGAFPPGEDFDWAAAADALCGTLGETPGGCVGLRGAMDEPPWFQFLNRRRTQFEFKDYDAIYAELLTPMGRMTYDVS